MNKILMLSVFASISLFANEMKHIEKNPQMEAALKECSASSGQNSTGKPDMTKIDTCMTAKGFTKPNHDGKGRDGSSDRKPPQK